MENEPDPKSNDSVELKKDWKFYLGITLLAISILTPILVLVIPFLGLPAGLAALIAGACLVGVPEICALIAIALLGKETWNYLVSKLKEKLPALPTRVSKSRYYLGLTLNIGSLIPLYIAGYFPDILPPQPGRLYVMIAGDLVFVASFFILGGQFWEKFKSLFVYE